MGTITCFNYVLSSYYIHLTTPRICIELLKLNRHIINDEDCDSNTALHLACASGHSKVVETLIKWGAEIQARNYYLWTPLGSAAANGQPNCVRLLLSVSTPNL